MDPHKKLRAGMVKTQLAGRDIADSRVLEVFRKVPRHIFVKEQLQQDAYKDFPLPIGCGQTISQPYMAALMTQCLELKGGEKILEIGTGSGYQTAVLAELAEEVYTIERHKELAERAREVLCRLNYNNIHLKAGDGTFGWQEYAPYNGIIVTAGAPNVPKALKKQMADGGRLVIPVGRTFSQTLLVIEKKRNKFIEKELCGCVFVPLVGRYGWEKD